jgi:hypothetical protein
VAPGYAVQAHTSSHQMLVAAILRDLPIAITPKAVRPYMQKTPAIPARDKNGLMSEWVLIYSAINNLSCHINLQYCLACTSPSDFKSARYGLALLIMALGFVDKAFLVNFLAACIPPYL